MADFRQQLPLPTSGSDVRYWDRLYGCAQAQAILQNLQGHTGLIIVPDVGAAVDLCNELEFFSGKQADVSLFPDWETLAYDIFSPHQDITSERLRTLAKLQQKRPGLFIIGVDTLLQRLPPASFLRTRSIALRVGDKIDWTDFRRRLDDNGYHSTPQVTHHGEYAVRGSILDFFPPGYDQPIRCDCFDDELESLRSFNPETQISSKRLDSVEILPAREFPLDDKAIANFRQSFRAEIDSPPEESLIYRDISEGKIPGGIEYYLPLFFEQTASFFDYLPADAVIISSGDLQSKMTAHRKAFAERYSQLRHNQERPPLEPKRLFLDDEAYQQQCSRFRQIIISDFKKTRKDVIDGGTRLLPTLGLQTDLPDPAANLKTWLKKFKGRSLIVTETAGYREQLLETLIECDVRPKTIENWQSFLQIDEPLCICVGKIGKGVHFEQQNLALIADVELLGHKIKQRRRSRATNTQAIIQNLNDLEMDCPVVHEKHGVGRFKGLETIDVGGYPAELIVIEYADNDKLYVPIDSLPLISRYTSGNSETAPLHKLGGDQWQKTKRKAAQKAYDAAAELLDIYSRREAATGTAFKIDHKEYKHFANAFPYQETPDQLKAIEDIFVQMQDSKPMDHVVCGDVGFGKTEIAMRAAFIAVQNGCQVAVLVPTTLLANQHHQTFRERFADLPVQIGMLSRFVATSRQRKTLQAMEQGKLDIVIGTHKLLQKNIRFKRLGLIVTDEEQRFGVRHKEHLKSAYSGIDMLTLSATPLPRTLNMTLGGLRTLSIIAIPPPHRHAVKTYVTDWNDELIREACHRELRRGGQIFFLHNKIETIDETAERLRKLIPKTDIRIAHGKMTEKDLEAVMMDFYRRRFSVLICTTIIESGIDIPTANSIIINQAERFGLAQLHQLRGRVGRSHHRAYAYLLLGRPRALLSGDSVRRLQAIESLEDLGIGFALASQDLEIRGAGELLGEEQSGHIQEVGFTLYNQILKRAVDTLRAGKIPDMDKPLNAITEINCGEPAFIPTDYIPDTNIRLVLYRRIAAARDEDELADLKWEMIDRFGTLPPFAKNLFTHSELRLTCLALGISKIEFHTESGMIEFNENPNINVDYLLSMVQNSPTIYSLTSQKNLLVNQTTETIENRVTLLKQLFKQLTARAVA